MYMGKPYRSDYMKFKLRLYDIVIIAICVILIGLYIVTMNDMYVMLGIGIFLGSMTARFTMERMLSKSNDENFIITYRKFLGQNLLIYAVVFVITAFFDMALFIATALSIIVYRNLFLNSHK